MTHYSEDESAVRVDFFKVTGKWSHTEAVRWIHTPDTTWEEPGSIVQEFRASVAQHLLPDRLRGHEGLRAVCLEPYHPHAHPLSWVCCFDGSEDKITTEQEGVGAFAEIQAGVSGWHLRAEHFPSNSGPVPVYVIRDPEGLLRMRFYGTAADVDNGRLGQFIVQQLNIEKRKTGSTVVR